MKLKMLMLMMLLSGGLSFTLSWRSSQEAEATRNYATALERLGLGSEAVLKAAPELTTLRPLAYTITQVRTLTDKDGVERYHLTRQRLVRSDGSFIERTTYNNGRIIIAWASSDGKFLSWQKDSKEIKHDGQAVGLPDPAQLYQRARQQNLLFVIESGLPAFIETHQPDNPQRRIDTVQALQITLPLRIAHPNGHTTTVSLIKGEPDQAEWDRIKAAVPEGLPIVDGGN